MKLFFDFHYYLYLFIWFETRQVLIGRSWPSKIKNSFFFSFNFFLNFYFIYLFMYFFVYTPSNQRFKAFPVSKFNSETSFLYQLFKENSNLIVLMLCMFIYTFIHLYINILKPSLCLNSILRQVFCINFSRSFKIS